MLRISRVHYLGPKPRASRSSEFVAAAALLQLGVVQLALRAHIGALARHHALDDIKQRDGLAMARLQIRGRVRFDQYQDDARILRAAVARAALITEPRAPVGRVELADALWVARQSGDAAHRHKFVRAVLVI